MIEVNEAKTEDLTTPEEQQQPEQLGLLPEGVEPQPGDTLAATATVGAGNCYEWGGVKIAGLPEPVTLMVIASESEEGQPSILIDGRPIAFEGEVFIVGNAGRVESISLPAGWDYQTGPSRLAEELSAEDWGQELPAEDWPEDQLAEVGTGFAPGPQDFELTVCPNGQGSSLSIGGQPVSAVSRVTLDIEAGELPELRVYSAYVQGQSTGQAVPTLIVNAIAQAEQGLTTDADTEEVLWLLKARQAEPGASLLQGSLAVPTEHGDRLATFVMGLSHLPEGFTPAVSNLGPVGVVEVGTADQPSPGQAAYESFTFTLWGPNVAAMSYHWPQLSSAEQAAWAAAAQAAAEAMTRIGKAAAGLQDGEDNE